ncbi:acid ceramidase subunit beta [Thecamonas trahens ATCC 50062]|uniref:ceramidase n=1 Tax=Thecamonas trahens ATCC 50062 TaxID=461836 RepID=A0A0L0DL39_THETB|nr:acid ceramidase subunit beta [Thecamonas trahens ATCC 50062]KNC52083.1 acid ceramidase subunit beta [Thecamonas trahens ATCC 50062]|eukprot:XP_013762088.1 acid ceramidase subunit beta [Thecamonas trahens ATCC 50062]
MSRRPRRGRVKVPRFRVDLDDAPTDRWTHIVREYKEDFVAIRAQLQETIREEAGPRLGAFIESVLSTLMSTVTKMGAVYYGAELKGIARETGMPLGMLAVLQLVYEASAACTSIVVPCGEGPPVHIRTMDWEMDFLRPLTIEVEFWRDGVPLYVAPTWAGAVGVLTACKTGAFSASVNFRLTEDGSYWGNVKRLLARSWPIGFLLREVCESTQAYADAADILATASLVAPVYFTLCGIAPGEGCIITRGPSVEERRWELAADGPCVQTNVDYFDVDGESDIMWSRERLALGRSLVDSLSTSPDREALFGLVSTWPICNELTVYASYLEPITGVVKTYLPNTRSGFRHRSTAVAGPDARVRCRNCRTRFTESLNASGRCAHVGDWHAAYNDCSKIKCAWGLKSSIGKQHWSCCFSTSRRSRGCPRSGAHVPGSDSDSESDSDDSSHSPASSSSSSSSVSAVSSAS